VLFYHDPRGDGSGFSLQNVAIDLRCTDKQGKHGPKPISQQAPSASANINTDPDPTPLARADTEIVMNDGSRNSLVNRFWELKGSQRREICLRLRLIDEQQVSLPEIQRDKRALLRAAERGMLEKLAEEIVKLEDG
jgi:hypothetical protein